MLVAAAVVVAGCGGDKEGKPIPAATATGLQAQLDGVEKRINQGSAGACKDILEGPRGPNKQQVQNLIDAMPDSVDADMKSALQDSFDHLWDLVQQDCDDKASQTHTETTPTETPPETTPTETTPTETTPTETTPTSPDNAPLPNDGNGNGNGNGNGGNGNGIGGGVSPGSGE